MGDELFYMAGGVLVVLAIILVVAVIRGRKPVAVRRWAHVIPTADYTSVGDSTADGTPVVAAPAYVPPVVSAPAYVPPIVSPPVASAPVSPAAVIQPPSYTPPVDQSVQTAVQTAVQPSVQTPVQAPPAPTIAPGSSITSADIAAVAQVPAAPIPAALVVPIPVASIIAPEYPSLSEIGSYFTKYAGKIWKDVGTPMGSKPLSNCQQTCFMSPGCAGINYNAMGNECSLVMSDSSPLLTDSTVGGDFYHRLPTLMGPTPLGPADALSRYSLMAGTERVDADAADSYFTIDAETCAAGCTGDVDCTGFHWTGNMCRPMRGHDISLTTNYGMTYYNKTPAFPSLLAAGDTTDYLKSFIEKKDAMITGAGPMYNATTAGECAAACLKDSACMGFNRSITGACQRVGTGTTKDGVYGMSLYMLAPKPVAPPPPADSLGYFTKYPGKLNGMNVNTSMAGPTTALKCADKCVADPKCKAFNYWVYNGENGCGFVSEINPAGIVPNQYHTYYERM